MTERRLRTAIGALCLAGLAIAGYLTYVHYRGISPFCAIGHGCETVQASRWAKLAGIPVALLGLAGYLGILGATLMRQEAGRLAAAGMSFVGFGFSAYLTYREIASIKAICPWCVASAVLMTLLVFLTTLRFLRAPVQPDTGSSAAQKLYAS